MEDPNMEWEIQEYSPSKEGEVTTVRWIFNKGLWLGKKFVITGVAVSSAPLVLPPLVVFSALGFAFSVPFGLVFASYACTDKLMKKLLPTPEPSPMLEYYTYEDEEEKEGKEGFGKFVMEEEKEKEFKDTKRGVGMRIYSDEDDDYWQKDFDSWEEQPTIYNDENVEEEGYEDDVGEYLEGKDDCTQKVEVRDEKQEENYKEYIDENVEEEDYIGKCVERGDGYTQTIQMRDENREEYKDYIDECVEDEGYLGKYVEGEDDYTQTIRMRDENQGEKYKEYIDENVEEKGYEDAVGKYEKRKDDYTQKIDMGDENQGEEYKEYIGENVAVEGDNVEEIELRVGVDRDAVGECVEGEDDYTQKIDVRDENLEVRKVGDREELINKGSKVEEQLDEISRVVVIVGEDKEKHGNDGEVKGVLEIKDEPVRNEVTVGLDEIEFPTLVMEEDRDKEGYKEEDYSVEGTKKDIEVTEEGDLQKLVGEKGNDEIPLAEICKVTILVPGNDDNNDATEVEFDLVASAVRGGKDEKETIDEEDIVRESTGLLEKIRDEGNVRDPIGDPLEDDDVLLKKLVEEVKETGERERAVEETPMPFGRDVKLEEISDKFENTALENQERNFIDKVEQVGDAQDKGLGNKNTIGYVNGKLAAKSIGEVQEERAAYNNSSDQVEHLTLKKRENVISSNADMREIADESGFDLFDDRNMPTDQDSYSSLQAKDDFNESTTVVNVDYMALPSYTRVFHSRHVKKALEKDEVPSSQVQLKEEEEEEEEEEKKIWEQIDAMRAIVGYKVDRQPTCIEELEALYIFTGVEPPASFKDPSDDLSDVSHKLRFLMSIVGVR